MDEEQGAKIQITRNVFLQHSDSIHKDTVSEHNSCLSIRCKPKKFLKTTFPVVGWLYTYQWKEWLIKDLIAGITVAVMNIPQGMAYALLGNVPPVVGIYMGLFPVLVYALLGTSRHVSMGSFAVICLMAGNVVTKHTEPSHAALIPGNTTVMLEHAALSHYTPIEVASSVAFLVGAFQLLLYVFRFGIFCTLLSETLVSGFTAGAAIHVFTSQLKDIFGIKIRHYHGPLKLIFTYGELFSKIYTANLGAVVISAITLIVLIANNQLIKPFVSKRCMIPVPIELIVVLVGTLASTYGGIASTYALKVVGDIPVGLPEPKLPPFSLFPSIIVDSLVIAVIAYVITLSMALIFANKLKYDIHPNQELFAQGWGNLVGSIFSCLPFSASLSRSAIQEAVGGCTQLASVFSAVILTIVLIWIAPFFELLPRCVLASLIIVALSGILFQVTDIVGIWRVSSLEAIVWITTYLTVIIVDIDYGLLAGVVASVLILFVRGAQLQIVVLERLSNSEIFLAADTYAKTERIPGALVLSYSGCINFVNKASFKKKTLEAVFGKKGSSSKVVPEDDTNAGTVIMDLKSVSYIDSSGARMVKTIVEELASSNKSVLFASVSESSLSMFRICEVFSVMTDPIFPTIQDAVSFSQFRAGSDIYSIRL